MLETIWFLLWGVLWAVYFMLDGFDLGLGTMLPFVARTDTERRVVINSMGPFWDGNEVWLVTAGGVTFAAFPRAYAVMFSALYLPLMLLLFALIIRGISFEFRSKLESPRWRSLWDGGIFIGSFLPALLFGVTFANLFSGIAIDAEGVMQGGLLELLSPYGMLGGLVFVFLFLMHGSLWLAVKTDGVLQERGAKAALAFWPVAFGSTVMLIMVSLYRTSMLSTYRAFPLLFVLPALAVLAFVGVILFIRLKSWWKAWGASCAAISLTVLSGVAGMYPSILISTLNPMYNVTAFNSASSELTLKIMLGIALSVIPLVIVYQAWVYRRFGYKVRFEDLHDGESY